MSGKVKLREKETELLFNSFQFASWKGSRKRDGAKGNEREKGRAKGRSTSGRQRECRSGLRRSKGIDESFNEMFNERCRQQSFNEHSCLEKRRWRRDDDDGTLSLSLHSITRFDFVMHRFVHFSFPFRLKSKNRTLNAISRLLYTAISAGRCVNEAALFCDSHVRLIAYVR